ncbi:hypothetical protein [Streptomyces sp. NPDC088350]|uniref:hypothetical protein n=1 Tax=Streptomyces sp. NPDC088350 TaxID=3365854 RepID=UPI003809AAEE
MALVAAAGPAGGAAAITPLRAADPDPVVTVFHDVLAGSRLPRREDTWFEVPGASVRFVARPRQRVVMDVSSFSMTAVTRLARGQNVEAGAFLSCPQIPLGRPDGVHFGDNIAPGFHDTVSPVLRWVFKAPQSTGSVMYTCKVEVKFNSTIQRHGPVDVRLTAPRGAVRVTTATPAGAIGQWFLKNNYAVGGSRQSLLRTNGHPYTPTSSQPYVTVRQDVQLSTCNQGSRPPYAECVYEGTEPSKVSTWVEAQPQTPDGRSCGMPLRGPVTTSTITRSEHHRTVPNSLTLAKSSLPVGCGRLRLSLLVRHHSGEPVLVHGGTYGDTVDHTRRTAYTHGYAFEQASR